jgi:hypothetical protein
MPLEGRECRAELAAKDWQTQLSPSFLVCSEEKCLKLQFKRRDCNDSADRRAWASIRPCGQLSDLSLLYDRTEFWRDTAPEEAPPSMFSQTN